MVDFSSFLQDGDVVLRRMNHKTDSAVLNIRHNDGREAVLRIYPHMVTTYQSLTGHKCECLPQVYGTYEREGFFVVEEEYIDGVSLMEMISGSCRFDAARTIALSLKICSALNFLHASGFLHRDVKPEHVLLTADQKAVLIDLDASMRILPDKKNDTQLIGTALYAAPEQFGLTRSDQRADVYAMGILMNEMLTGEHPTVKRYQEGPLADVIERCIRMNLEERYQSVDELMQALKRAGSAVPGKYAQNTSKKDSKKKLVAGICAVVLMLAVLAGVFLMRDSAELPDRGPEGQTVTVDGVEYLQLYKGERRLTTYRNFRLGYQFDKLFTEDGTQVDESWNVYTDSQVGFINGWEESFGGWRVQSEGCDIDARGYLYAEKDGKQYAIEVIVLGEPMSAYVSVPELGNLTEGYLQPEHHPSIHEREVIRLTYRKNEPVILYLAAMEGASNLEMPVCSSALIHIEPFDGADAWDKPVFTMTYENPDGGDALVEVQSNVGHLIFYFEEE